MTKEKSEEIKKVLKKENISCSFYFVNKTQELRVGITTRVSADMGTYEKFVREKILKVLAALSKNGLRPRYRIDRKNYYGTVDARYLVFK